MIFLLPYGLKAQIIEKKISREVDINTEALVKILNQGKTLNIRTWDSNKVKMEVDLYIEAQSKELAEEFYNSLDFEIQKSSQQVYINGYFGTKRLSDLYEDSRLKNIKTGKIFSPKKFERSITIYMPKDNPLELSSSFSSVTIENDIITAKVDIFLSSLKGKNFNNLSIHSFSSKLNFKDISNKLTLNISSTDLQSGRINNLEINKSAFSTIDISFCNNAIINQLSGKKMNIDTLGSICGESIFLDYAIEKLKGNFDIKTQSGMIKINNVEPDFQLIKINATFTEIDIKIDEKANYHFMADLKFPHIEVLNGKINQTQGKSIHDKIFEGNIGKENFSRNPSQVNLSCTSCQIKIQ